MIARVSCGINRIIVEVIMEVEEEEWVEEDVAVLEEEEGDTRLRCFYTFVGESKRKGVLDYEL